MSGFTSSISCSSSSFLNSLFFKGLGGAERGIGCTEEEEEEEEEAEEDEEEEIGDGEEMDNRES